MKKRKSRNTSASERMDEKTEMTVNCFVQAAKTISKIDNANPDVLSVVKELGKEAISLSKNDLSEIEYTLLMQAKTLDHFFHQTMQRLTNLEMINQLQVFADIALRAQNLSRKTYLALADLKSPKRTTFIKQQNNAVNQQINSAAKPAFSKSEKPANELLEVNNGKRLDIRAKKETIQVNPPMEALEKGRHKN